MSGLRRALYYPHTELPDDRQAAENVVRSSLLLWDRIEFIVPYKDYRAKYDGQVARAMEFLAENRLPTDDEKREAHNDLEAFVKNPLPQGFYYQPHRSGRSKRPYELWPSKLLHETWDMLHGARFTGLPLSNADIPSTELGGLAIMAILADVCAGSTRARITDESDAYAVVTSLLAGRVAKNPARTDAAQRLSVVPLPIIDPQRIPLENLIALREKEERDRQLRELRHRYLDNRASYVDRLLKAETAADIEEINRNFQDDATDDYANLMNELGQSKRKFALSKWVFATAIGLPAAVIAHLLGATFAIEGVLTATSAPLTAWDFFNSLNDLGSRKAEILKKHPTAYLYQLSTG